jgi:two-component system, chemotaxis family, CheB/CheR fusion protein
VGSATSIRWLHILVVDDDSDVRDVLMWMLDAHGARVQFAASAREAFDILDGTATHLLLADFGMPDEDGLSLIQKVRARELANGRPRHPAIAVTAYASATDRDRQ